MRTATIMGFLVSGALMAAIVAQPQPAGPYAIEVDQDEGMKAWVASQQTGKYHEFLGRLVGSWDLTMEIAMGPDQDPMISKGTSTIAWQIPGKWIRETARIEMMGQSLDSFMVMGYDNVKRQFVSMVIDSMSTEMKTMKGGISPDGTVITQFGEMDEPITGEHAKMVRYRTTFHDEDHFTLEISEIVYGEAWTPVRVRYTRTR